MWAWAGAIGKRETTDPQLAPAWERADQRPGRLRRRVRRSRNEWVWSTGHDVTRILIKKTKEAVSLTSEKCLSFVWVWVWVCGRGCVCGCGCGCVGVCVCVGVFGLVRVGVWVGVWVWVGD